jgi:hypothetical protein
LPEGWVMLRCLLSALLLEAMLMAQPADVDFFFPAGGQRGSTVEVSFPDLGEDAQFWTDHPGLSVKLTGKDQAQVSLAADLPLGLHWLRAYNASGTSEPRWFSVGTLTEARETEPNNELAAPMPIDHLPVCVNGTLEEGTAVDLYSLQLQQGQTLTAALEAYALGSEVDAFLELRGPEGQILATVHDGRSIDPVLIFPVQRTGRYVLQVAGFLHPPSASVQFAGAESLVYRLHLHQDAVITHCYPAAVSRTSPTMLSLHGTAELPVDSRSVEIIGSQLPQLGVQYLDSTANLWPMPVLVTDSAVRCESEPNDAPASAIPIAINSTVAGRMDGPADRDGFTFTVQKGLRYSLRLHAQDLHLPLDGYLQLYAGSSQDLLAENDDTVALGTADPELSWKATADGPVRAVVITLLPLPAAATAGHYVLTLQPGREPLEAQITSASSYLIPAGKTAEIKAKLIAPYGFTGKIKASAQNLPTGLTAEPVEVKAENGAEFTLVLRAANNCTSWSGPLQLALVATGEDKLSTQVLAYCLPREDAQRGMTQRDRLDHVWITLQGR